MVLFGNVEVNERILKSLQDNCWFWEDSWLKKLGFGMFLYPSFQMHLTVSLCVGSMTAAAPGTISESTPFFVSSPHRNLDNTSPSLLDEEERTPTPVPSSDDEDDMTADQKRAIRRFSKSKGRAGGHRTVRAPGSMDTCVT
jgi:hypothetical protein